MRIIALTGGIGSGKSTVAEIFRTMGYAVYDSDHSAKSLYDSDPILQKEVIDLFGKDIYHHGHFRKEVLADKIFQEKDLLQALNACVHPAVKRDFLQWSEKQNKEPVFFETALLPAALSHLKFDQIMVVTAPVDLRIQRVMHRSGLTKEAILARMAQQINEEELCAMADVVIHNDTHDAILPSVWNFIEQYINN